MLSSAYIIEGKYLKEMDFIYKLFSNTGANKIDAESGMVIA
jgi:hypothetical protein